jgi:hypothetical protein
MNKLRLCAVLAFLPSLASASAQANSPMFTWDGSHLSPLMNPEGIACDHWSIWVFSDGQSPIPGFQWGAVTGATPAEVTQKWQEADENLHHADQILNHYGPHTMGYDAHLGPICILRKSSPRSQVFQQQADDIFNQAINQTANVYDFIRQRVAPEIELSAYVSNLILIEQRVQQIRTWLEATNGVNFYEVQHELDHARNQMGLMDRQFQQIAASHRAASYSSSSYGGTSSGDTSWSGKTVRTQSGQSTVTLTGSGLQYVGVTKGPIGNTITSAMMIPFSQIVRADQYGNNIVEVIFRNGIKSQITNTATTYSPSITSPLVRIAFDSPADAQSFMDYVNRQVRN